MAALAVALGLLPNWQARAENENFSNKPAPALFNADCTGAGCHKGPQGLGKGQSQSGLAGFLREHYTNSRESAAALAAYILKMPAGPAQPEPKPTRTSTPRGGEREPRGGSWFDPAPSGPAEARPGRQQQEKEKEKERERTRPSRSAAKPPAEAKPAEPKPEAKPAEAKPAESEEPSSSAAAPAEPAAEPEAKPEPKPTDRRRRTAEPVEKPEPKPAPVPRNQRGRQPAVAATPAPAAAPAEHTPPPAPAAPPPPQYDIFD
ncbi:hypothetical protein [Rhodoplanes sp. Z2-YC6860]|uniref:hypothetical protein n=1 Tax=Rhodoplanes sp. Z2-YC6860 TaxID=674703 RepID=UPI000829D9AE|nr:hypothetical protein [Rhodoplanes sp. Z2-YC6860]